MGYLSCGPERWIVDGGPIYTERLFGVATKKTDKSFFLVLRFLKATTPFVVFIFYLFMVWPAVLCPRTRYASISLALYLDQCRLFGLLCLTVCDHIIISCISLGCRIGTNTGCNDVVG